MKVRIIASINLWTNADRILTRTLRSIFGRPRRVGRVLSAPQKQLPCTVSPGLRPPRAALAALVLTPGTPRPPVPRPLRSR